MRLSELFFSVYDYVIPWDVAVVDNSVIIDQIQLVCSAGIEF